MRFPSNASATAANGDPLLNCDTLGNDFFNQTVWTLIHTIREGGQGGALADFDSDDPASYSLLTNAIKALNHTEYAPGSTPNNGSSTHGNILEMWATTSSSSDEQEETVVFAVPPNVQMLELPAILTLNTADNTGVADNTFQYVSHTATATTIEVRVYRQFNGSSGDGSTAANVRIKCKVS